MKLLSEKLKKKKSKKVKTDNIVIKNGENEVRVYPKKTMLVENLTYEKQHIVSPHEQDEIT